MLGLGVLAELQRCDAMLVVACKRLYAERGAEPGDYHGLFVSYQEFVEMLERPFGEAFLPLRDHPVPAIDDQVQTSDGAWQHLVRAFDLTPFEQDVLLLCLLSEVDLKYDRVAAYLQDDVTAKRFTVDLLLNLLCLTLPERILARQAFEPDSALARYGLVQIAPPHDGHDAFLRRTVTVATDVARFLLCDGAASPPPEPYWHTLNGDALTVYPSDQQDLFLRLVRSEALPYWVHVHAQDRWSAEALAAEIAAWRGLPVLHLALDDLLTEGIAGPVPVRDALRQALLTNVVLLVTLPGEGQSPEEPRLPPGWDALLRATAVTAVFHVPDMAAAPMPAGDGLSLFRVYLARPAFDERQRLWSCALDGATLAHDADLAELATRYRLEGAQIWAAAQSAQFLARQRDPAAATVSFDDLSAGARAVSSVRLGKLAQQITPRHRWEDLVLPPDRLAQLAEMCDQFRHRHIVYDTWGMGARSSRGQGISALLAGPSGTGKTMAAEVLANDLALDLFKIDLSGVVSKYIGETEKNLDRIFDLARDSNAILLFDEADALFGKRSETKDAHDRYANIEISYLLQKVEEYDGVVILTSNLRQNLDEAFMRRLQFSIEFPFPERDARLLIWQRTVSEGMPLAPDVNWEALAERFKLSGGSIRNALVTAAFLAARDGEAVGMRHLLWGIRREFQKLGKLIEEDEFAPLRAAERVSRRHGP